MSFRLGKQEPPAEGIRRICFEELDETRRLLLEARDNSTALHDSRKQLKKLRALLRLGAPALGRTAASEIGHLGEAARVLSRHRESDAFRAQLEREARIAGSTEFDILESALQLHLMAHAEPGNRARDLASARRIVRAARLRLAVSAPGRFPRGLCRRRFRKAYKRARGNLAIALETPSTEAAHNFRKASKLVLNQARLLRSWGGGEFTQFRNELVAIDDLLGRARDCGALSGILRGVPAAEAPLGHGMGLRARLDQIAREALAGGVARARVVYKRSSREFARCMFD